MNKDQALSAFHFQEYLGMLFRGKWIVLGIFGLVFGGTVILVATAPRVYQATTGVRIDTKKLQASIFHDPGSYVANLNTTQNELEILKSNTLSVDAAKKMLEQGRLDTLKKELLITMPPKDPPSKDTLASIDQVASRVRGAVSFEPVRESDVIKITARSENPREAALLANTYARAYYDRNVYASRANSRSFREFLQTQLEERQQSLKKAEESLRSYMEQKGVVSLDEESRRTIEQLSQLESQRDAVDISIQALQKTLATYGEQVAQQEQSVAKVMGEANDPYIRLLQDQLAQLEVQRDITVAQNPSFVGREVYNTRLNEIEGQIQALKLKLKKRTDDFLTNLLPSGETGSGQGDPSSFLRQTKQKVLQSQIELQSLMARKKALGEAIQEYNRQFEHLPKKTMDVARLQRDKSSLEKLYLTIEEKYNEANITEQGELGYIDIYDPATVPDSPSSPKVNLTLMMGIVAGLGLGIMTVIIRERSFERVRTPEDLKKHGFVPVLSTVLHMDDEIRDQSIDAASQNAHRNFDHHIIMVWNPLSPIAESYRHLRTNALYTEHGVAPCRILVTSAEAGEGKTTTACNLAISLAQLGKRVLLFDTDLRQPAIHTNLGVRMTPGLSEVVEKKATLAQAVQQLPIQNLWVLTSGNLPGNPSEFVGSDAMKLLVEQALREYDMVVFDGPPVLAVTDSSILAGMTDRVVFVVSSGATPTSSVRRAVETLQELGRRQIGYVLNGFDIRQAYGYNVRRYGYGYGYGYRKESSSKKERAKKPVQIRD